MQYCLCLMAVFIPLLLCSKIDIFCYNKEFLKPLYQLCIFLHKISVLCVYLRNIVVIDFKSINCALFTHLVSVVNNIIELFQ